MRVYCRTMEHYQPKSEVGLNGKTGSLLNMFLSQVLWFTVKTSKAYKAIC